MKKKTTAVAEYAQDVALQSKWFVNLAKETDTKYFKFKVLLELYIYIYSKRCCSFVHTNQNWFKNKKKQYDIDT